MLVLSCDKVSKSFGDRKIFENVSLKIYSEDRIGLVGANGSGKSTLLKILAQEELPDEGQIKLYSSMSYVRQQDDGVPEASSPSSTGKTEGRLFSLLNVDAGSIHKNMSGGEKSKTRFSLSYDPQCGLLIADEPTSNMDLQAVETVEKELSNLTGALLIVSHDRSLLDRLCTSIIEISDGKIKQYQGNYSSYIKQREETYRRQKFEYEAYVKEKSRLESRVQERVENAKSILKAPKRMGNSEARLHKREGTQIQAKLSRAVEAMRTRIDQLDVKERPNDLPDVRISIDPPKNPVSSTIVRADLLTVEYPGRPLLTKVSFEIPARKRTALLGPNGTGKTTLVERILSGDPSISIAPGVKIGYFKQNFSQLEENRTVLENVMRFSIRPEHEVRTILARLLIARDDVFKPISVLSGGEKVKVSLAQILVSDANFIILDEPTNYLDVYSMEALENVLCDYTGTLLLISHDRKFIENIAQRLLIIENGSISTFEGSVTEYEAKQKAQKQLQSSEVLNATIINMRLAELSSRIDSCRDEVQKKALETQYFELCRMRK